MMPERVQRRRIKGYKMPPNTVSVTRPGKHGNPYYPGCGIGYGGFNDKMEPVQYDVRDPRVQVAWFRIHLENMKKYEPKRFKEYIAPLVGKNVACFCTTSAPCHGDVLIEFAALEVVDDLRM